MKRLKDKQINKMKELYKEGKKIKEIADIFKTSMRTIMYHVKPGQREKDIKYAIDNFKKKSKEERSKIYKKRLPYLKEYIKRRYHEDKDFREKIKKRNRNAQRRRKKKELGE